MFIGRGPHFKVGEVHPPFDNVEVYGMVTHILGIPPAPNNGTGITSVFVN